MNFQREYFYVSRKYFNLKLVVWKQGGKNIKIYYNLFNLYSRNFLSRIIIIEGGNFKWDTLYS